MKKLYRILGKRGRITIPYEIRQRVGFSYNDVLSFTEADDGRTVMGRSVNKTKAAINDLRLFLFIMFPPYFIFFCV